MGHRIHVSWHVSTRFAQRIDAVSDPIFSVINMWDQGRPAEPEDFALYRCYKKPDCEYRVGKHKDFYMMLVYRDGCILTLISLYN